MPDQVSIFDRRLRSRRRSDRSSGTIQSRNARGFLASAIVLLLALILLAVWCGHAARVRAAAETKLEQEQVHLTSLLYFVQQAETSQRGYLLTGAELYLAPYKTAAPQVPVVLAHLGAVTDISALRPLVEGKMQELAATVAQAEAGKHDAALARVRTDVGLRGMSNIRAWVAAEQERLSQRLKVIRAHDERDAVLFEVTALLCVLTAVGLAWMVMRGLLATNVALGQSQFAAETANRDMVEAREGAELATLAKSMFLANMSHELRTPLNAILGFGQLLASKTMQATEEQKQEFVYQIIKAGKHLLTLINEILDLSKIEAGKVVLSLEPVALGAVLLEIQALVAPLGSPRSISIIFPKETHLTVVADRTRLIQVLLNLLSNAIKYNREMGSVIVGCAHTSPERIRISVQDTGMGLTSEQVSALFQPFNRLGQEAGGEEGTGIGLVLTKRLVELMGGTIGVTSTPGVGSEFWIELDATEPATLPLPIGEEATPLKTIPNVHRNRATILYVEDNPANLELVRQILSFRTDIALISAPDAHLGIQLALAHLPKVILMDIHLPGMTGTEAQQILRDDPRTAHIPIIALTASAMPREVAKALAQGFFRYVTKPIDIEELIGAIDSALDRVGLG